MICDVIIFVMIFVIISIKLNCLQILPYCVIKLEPGRAMKMRKRLTIQEKHAAQEKDLVRLFNGSLNNDGEDAQNSERSDIPRETEYLERDADPALLLFVSICAATLMSWYVLDIFEESLKLI